MNRLVLRLIIVCCAALFSFESTRAFFPLEQRQKPKAAPAKSRALEPVRGVIAQRIAARPEPTVAQKRIAVVDDIALLPLINEAMWARDSGIAPEIREALSPTDGRLLQWLMLLFSADELRSKAGPGAQARRTVNETIMDLAAPREAP